MRINPFFAVSCAFCGAEALHECVSKRGQLQGSFVHSARRKRGAAALRKLNKEDETKMPVKILEPYQQRVREEEGELTEKLNKLDAFLIGPIYPSLPRAEQMRLHRQYLIMQLYQQVLLERIGAF